MTTPNPGPQHEPGADDPTRVRPRRGAPKEPRGRDSRTGGGRGRDRRAGTATAEQPTTSTATTSTLTTSASAARRGAADGPRRLSAKARARIDARVPFERMRGASRAWWLGTDLIVLMLLSGLLLLGWLPTFGWGWVAVTVLGGSTLGLAVALAGWRWRWNSALVLGVGVAAWFGLGGLLAMPSSLTAGVVPTLRTLRGLATGPVTAPKAMLTVAPPIGETWNLLTVPLLLSMVAAAAGLSLSLRTRRPGLAWLPHAIALLVTWALGTQITHQPVWVAIAAVAVVVLWTSTRRRMIRETLVQQRRRTAWATPLVGALVLAVAGGLTWASASALEPDGARRIARQQVQPPLQLDRHASPLQQFRGQISMNRQTTLLTVNGLPKRAPIRVATMDDYDGMTYNVSNSSDPTSEAGQFTRVGARIVDDTAGAPIDAQVTVAGYRGPWLPTVGQTTRVSFEGDRKLALVDSLYYNRASGTALATAGLAEGDTYALTAVLSQRPSDEAIEQAGAGSAVLPAPRGVPDSVRDLGLRWTQGTQTKGEAALAIEREFRQGWFSHGQDKEVRSLSGHSYHRLQELIAEPTQMVGDEEQYAVAMALMARQLGMPARVVYGFQAPESGTGDVRGDDVRAWTEIQLEGLGWVLFNPTPDHDRVLKKTEEDPPPRPRPHVENPPPVPKKPQVPPGDNDLDVQEASPPPQEEDIDWRRVGTVAAVIGLPVITLLGPLVLILGLKMRRRLQRKNNPIMANRFAGAWAELVDMVRDLGRSPSPTATRSEQAEAMVVQFPRVIEKADPIALAKLADSVVFSPDQVTDEHADSYWSTLKEAEKGVRQSVSGWAWLKSRLSTRSFRRYR